MGLTVNFGSRGRPDDLVQTLHESMKHLLRDDTKVLVALDDDDQPSIDAVSRFPDDPRIIVSIKPREDTRGPKCDRALTEAPNSVYTVGHDSASIVTPGWDELIVHASQLFPDGIGVVCSGMANASFPAMQCVTQGWVDIVGHIYNHDYPFWFIDHELDDLCRMTGRFVFVPGMEVEHQTRRPEKTIRMRDLHFWADYYDLATHRRLNMAESIIDALDCPEWQRIAMKTWHPPVHARSQWINNTVRANAVKLEEERGERGEPDPGYLRAFERARQEAKAMRNELKVLFQQQQAA
jgi:hypothetical protein